MRAIFLLSILVLLLLQSACQDPEPLRIGFLGSFTTRAAGLSTSGRDGFLLAVEECNARGGINGRVVEGLVHDTHMHKETALQAVKFLIEQKVSAVIGPMTSQTAVAVVSEINSAGIPMISPTVSTNELSARDDYFFRVYYTNAQASQLLADRLYKQEQHRKVAVIYDLDNRAYTEDWVLHFQAALKDSDALQLVKIPYDLRSDTLFLDLANQAAASGAEAVLILANAVDTAMICQQLAKIGASIPRYATGWSYSDALLQFGGNSVEGLTIIQSANLQDTSPRMQQFVETYQKRFQALPNFPAIHAYDATRMILTLMEKTTNPQALKNELLKMSPYPGLQDDLAFDPYGELENASIHLARITNGQFVNID